MGVSKACGELHRPVRGRLWTVRAHCRRVLPLAAFSADPNSPDGLDLICRECKSIENGNGYAANREHRKEARRAYYVENHAEIRERERVARAANPEKRREQNRRYREKRRAARASD